MSSAYGQCSLFLHPSIHSDTPDNIALLISALRESGFIADETDPAKKDLSFFAGSRFLDYIAYMGCSPAIQFEPTEKQKNFCHIKILQFELPQLIHSNKQQKSPQCPKCNKPVKNWQHNISSETILCDLCHTRSAIEEYNWRKMAGHARLFIEITDIFPKEAIPQQLLLDKLTKITSIDWKYFYACQ